MMWGRSTQTAMPHFTAPHPAGGTLSCSFSLDQGADVNVKNKRRSMPLDVAEGVGRDVSFPSTAALLRKLDPESA
jgi:hypothetical protein